MLETYLGILKDNRIEWCGAAPKQPSSDQGVRVQVTVLDQGPVPNHSDGQGQRMAAALEKIATSGIAGITDPMAWEQEVRADRALPDREE